MSFSRCWRTLAVSFSYTNCRKLRRPSADYGSTHRSYHSTRSAQNLLSYEPKNSLACEAARRKKLQGPSSCSFALTIGTIRMVLPMAAMDCHSSHMADFGRGLCQYGLC